MDAKLDERGAHERRAADGACGAWASVAIRMYSAAAPTLPHLRGHRVVFFTAADTEAQEEPELVLKEVLADRQPVVAALAEVGVTNEAVVVALRRCAAVVAQAGAVEVVEGGEDRDAEHDHQDDRDLLRRG